MLNLNKELDTKGITKRFAEVRKKLNISQEQLASDINDYYNISEITQGKISHIENNGSGSLEIFIYMVNYYTNELDINMNWLLSIDNSLYSKELISEFTLGLNDEELLNIAHKINNVSNDLSNISKEIVKGSKNK